MGELGAAVTFTEPSQLEEEMRNFLRDSRKSGYHPGLKWEKTGFKKNSPIRWTLAVKKSETRLQQNGV
jgi:hypothetical protein